MSINQTVWLLIWVCMIKSQVIVWVCVRLCDWAICKCMCMCVSVCLCVCLFVYVYMFSSPRCTYSILNSCLRWWLWGRWMWFSAKLSSSQCTQPCPKAPHTHWNSLSDSYRPSLDNATLQRFDRVCAARHPQNWLCASLRMPAHPL